MKNNFIKSIMPHLMAAGIFTVLTWAYMFPILQGKSLAQHDTIQSLCMQQEIRQHHEKTGEWSLWTGSMFCGMPAYQIVLFFSSNPFTFILDFFRAIFPGDAELVFLLMLGFYILLYTFTKNPSIAVIGAIAFAFSSFNFISIDAGHTSKVRCIALVAPVLAGVIAAFRRRWFFGAGLTAFVLAFQIRSNHMQITYYTLLAAGVISLFYFIIAIREKQMKNFAKAATLLALAVVLSFGSNTSLLWTTWEYSKETIRGGSSELETERTDGLDKDYAFKFSYGKMETFTLLIPNFNGGASQQAIGENSHLAKLYRSRQVAKKQIEKSLEVVPTYWGGQFFTSGPTYFGAIVSFLLVFGMFIIRNPIKWAFFALAVFCIFLSWGENFETFNLLFLHYFPLYNKFRTPAMILTVANVAFVFIAALGLHELLSGKIEKKDVLKSLKRTLSITAGIIFAAGILGSFVFDFKSAIDAKLTQAGWQDEAIRAVRADRASLLRMDALRSLVLIAFSALLIWAFLEKKMKPIYFLAAIGALMLFDGWSVCKRYLNEKDFITKAEKQKLFQPAKVNLAIQQDTRLSYRVLNVTTDPFSEAKTSCFHKSIGGYHSAKLRRYQDLMEKQIAGNIERLNAGLSNENIPVLNMLNMRYFITTGDQVIRNANAMGNAWFVTGYKIVNDGSAEMNSLSHFNPAQEAIMDSSFNDYLQGLSLPGGSSSGNITLTSYSPDKLAYQAFATQEQLAVFSEVYYDKGWQAYLDGKPVEHIRVNYILRAMRVPAGQHVIEFKFEPKSYYTGEKISLACASLTLLLILGGIAVKLRRAFAAREYTVS